MAVEVMSESFNASETKVEMHTPKGITGLERIILAAEGNLQRILSSFFGRGITIERIYANTAPRTSPASPTNPITQTRQVHLNCDSIPVCIATSNVTITSPECENLFIDQGFAIGQLFRKMGQRPTFTLKDIETVPTSDPAVTELHRTYTLATEGIVCEILEVFPDREMFSRGESWLNEKVAAAKAL